MNPVSLLHWGSYERALEHRSLSLHHTMKSSLSPIWPASIIHRGVGVTAQRYRGRVEPWRQWRDHRGWSSVTRNGLGRGTPPLGSGRPRGPGGEEREAVPVRVVGRQRELDPA